MLLVIDVGNTNTSLGVYREDELLAHWRLTTNPSRTVDEYGVHARNLFELAHMDFKDIEAIAIASVVPPLNYTVKRMAEVYFHLTPLFIDHTTDTGLKQRSGNTGLQAVSCCLDLNRHQFPVGSQVEQLLAVAPPAGVAASTR